MDPLGAAGDLAGLRSRATLQAVLGGVLRRHPPGGRRPRGAGGGAAWSPSPEPTSASDMPREYCIDDVHPSAEGAAAIADVLAALGYDPVAP